MNAFTFGAEHELADIPIFDHPLPEEFGRDDHDITIVNSDGIANDPKGKYHRYGGEVNTPPTKDSEGQVALLRQIKDHFPWAKVNYRSNLHIHVRVPGLREDLDALKQFQRYIHRTMPEVLAHVEPLPRPSAEAFPDPEELAGAERRWRRRKQSHQTLLTAKRLERQLNAPDLGSFFEWEVPQAKATGKPQWQCQPRLCVNLRQLLQTDTIEFRHFPGTLDEGELRAAIDWCAEYTLWALNDKPIDNLLRQYDTNVFPAFEPYIHWMEKRYRATCHDGTLDKATIAANIKAIQENRFDD
jgi:hypothetical protein